MIKVYSYSIGRGKSGIKGKSSRVIRKQLYKGFCGNCLKTSELKDLDLDHKIPVFIGGKKFDADNLWLLCHKCHNEKTINDKAAIEVLKKFKLIGKSLNNLMFVEPQEVYWAYKILTILHSKGKSNYLTWLNGTSGIDYEHILWKDNELQEIVKNVG